MNRRVLLLLLVVVLAAAAVILLVQSGVIGGGSNNTPPSNPAAQAPTVVVNTATPIILHPIIVALQELPRGIRIPAPVGGAPAFGWEYYPDGAVPPDAIGVDPSNTAPAFAQVTGKIARNDIAVDQPILSTMLVDDLTQLAKVGSDAALVVPADRRAIAIPVDRNTAVAFAPRPGDYVDVIGSFLFTDVDQTFQSRSPDTLTFTSIQPDGSLQLATTIEGRLEPSSFSQFPVVVGPSETQRPRLATQMIVQSALVIQVGDFPLSGNFLGNTPTPLALPTSSDQSQQPTANPNEPPPASPTVVETPDVITIAVVPQDAVTLAWLIDARVPMTFVLRNAQNQNRSPTAEVTLRYIVQNFQVDEPAALPYALDPALRSIRNLVSGTLVPFAQDNTFGAKSP